MDEGDLVSTKPSTPIKIYLNSLQDQCGVVFSQSLTDLNCRKIANIHIFISEISTWCKIIGMRREIELFEVAALEYEFALLALAQGHYRHAFKGLRLVLELMLQGVKLSIDELLLREWINNLADTHWSAIIDPQNGIFSARFAKVFFPELSKHVDYYRKMAKTLYRECSESVHGNHPKHIPLPLRLEFDQKTFDLWCLKADDVILISHFALSLRYLGDVQESDLSIIEPFLSDRIGHIEEIRCLFGGPVKG